MSYDKTWSFTLNQTPALQDTLQHQCQSFLYFLKSNLLSKGWTAPMSSNGITSSFPRQITSESLIYLPDGRVLVVGGGDSVNFLATTYFGTISGNTITWVAGTNVPVAICQHRTVLLPDGRILIMGGNVGGNAVATTYFGTISGNTITWVAGTDMPQARRMHSGNILPDGRVLIIGGYSTVNNATTYWGTISGNTITWAAGTAYLNAIYGHASTVLPDGRVLVTGGVYSTAEVGARFGTISGNTITWNVGTSLVQGVYSHSATLLSDGRILISGGANASAVQQTSDYFGTISGTTITWVAGTALPLAMQDHAMISLSDGRILLLGGTNTGAPIVLGTCYLATINTNTITWTLTAGGDFWTDPTALLWNTSTAARSWVLLASPVGFVPGPDGSSTGSQSQMYLCIECVGASTTDYSKVNLTFYSGLPSHTPASAIPTGGNAQSVAVAGTQFINATLTAYRFHFASTAAGGFYAGISTLNNGGIMSTILGFLDLADVQSYGTNLYSYPAVGLLYYNNIVANLTYNIFDSVSNTTGIKCFNMDGTAGTARAMVWCNPNTTVQIPGTGTTQTGDVNGNLLDTPICIYTTTAGKQASIGRVPDFKGTGATGITNGVVDDALNPNYTIINQLIIPASTALLV